MDYSIATFATRDEAQAVVEKLDAQTYYLSHGEYERPDYRVRKVRGESVYCVRARYYYYAGTFGAKQSGPLTVEEVPE